MMLFMNYQRISCFSGSNILRNNFRMYPCLHDSPWPQDGIPSWLDLKLELCNHLQRFCEALCGHGWGGLSSLRLHLLLSWRDETLPAPCSLYHHLLPMMLVSSPWPRSSQSLPALLQKAKFFRLNFKFPVFSSMVYISSWKCSEAKMFGNVFWCFTPNIN